VAPGATPEIARRAREGFVPLIASRPGFVAYYLVSLGDDQVLTVTIFQDRATAEESAIRSADWNRQNLAHLFPNPVEATTGDVLVQITG
jgi:hypothetical protein